MSDLSGGRVAWLSCNLCVLMNHSLSTHCPQPKCSILCSALTTLDTTLTHPPPSHKQDAPRREAAATVADKDSSRPSCREGVREDSKAKQQPEQQLIPQPDGSEMLQAVSVLQQCSSD